MRSLLICITITLAPLGGAATAQDPDPAAFVGNWMGALNLGGVELRMRLDVTTEDGALSAVMYSIDQGNAAIPVASTTVTGATISVSMPMIAGSYEGTLSDDGEALMVRFRAPVSIMRYIVEKGFVAVDGTSLTIVNCALDRFSVTIIPYTRDNTVFHSRRVGDTVNIETDILAKYVERLSSAPRAPADILDEL